MSPEEFAALPPASPDKVRGNGGPHGVAPGSRVLPHSIEAEEHVLSACLLDGDGMMLRCLDAKVGPRSFYDPKHQIVFDEITRMHAAGIPIEAGVLAEQLRDRRKLDQVGGYAFLTQVSNRTPTTAQAAYFIRKVREAQIRRDIITASVSAIESAHDQTADLAELAADLTRRISFASDGRAKDPWPVPVSSSGLCDSPPAIPPILIWGLLYSPGTMLISGPSKSHKTFTSLDLAIAIASGTKWLGRSTTACPVLYLNLELQDFAIADRIARICAARGISPPPNLHIWNLRGKPMDVLQLSARLPAEIARVSARCVIIDPHYKISSISGAEESSNDDQGKLLAEMECLCHNCGAALILTHHFAKGDASVKNAQDRASGAGTFTRWPDVFLTFTPHDEDDAMTIEMCLRNFAPVDPFVVRWEYPRWQRDDSLDPSNLKTTSRGPKERQTADLALKKLSDSGMMASEWERASGMPGTTFNRKRKDLLADGRVKLVGNLYMKTGVVP